MAAIQLCYNNAVLKIVHFVLNPVEIIYYVLFNASLVSHSVCTKFHFSPSMHPTSWSIIEQVHATQVLNCSLSYTAHCSISSSLLSTCHTAH